MIFKKLLNFIKKCPTVFATIVVWIALLGLAYYFGVADISNPISTPAFVGLATEEWHTEPGFYKDESKMEVAEENKLFSAVKRILNWNIYKPDSEEEVSGDSGMEIADIDVSDYITDDIENIELADDEDEFEYVDPKDVNSSSENDNDEANSSGKKNDDANSSGKKNDEANSSGGKHNDDADSSGENDSEDTNSSDKNGSGNSDDKQNASESGSGENTSGKDGKQKDSDKDEKKPQIDPTKIVSSKDFVKFVKYDEKVEIDSPYFTDPGKYPITTEYDYTKEKQSYLDDAVFIGDSRTVGLGYYGGLDNATFYAKVGLNIYNLMDDEFIDNPNGKVKQVSVRYMLEKKTFGKIYISVGINELGIGDTTTWAKKYISVLQEIRDLQPDAIIFIQGIMPVAKEKSDGEKVFSNGNIRDKNCELGKLANGYNVFYLDIYSLYMDDKMNLPSDKTSDKVHLYAGEYKKWAKYILKHGVTLDK